MDSTTATHTEAPPNGVGFNVFAVAPDPRFIAARDADGGIRLNSGMGELIATADCSRADVQGWLDRAALDKWARKYRAALDLMDREQVTA